MIAPEALPTDDGLVAVARLAAVVLEGALYQASARGLEVEVRVIGGRVPSPIVGERRPQTDAVEVSVCRVIGDGSLPTQFLDGDPPTGAIVQRCLDSARLLTESIRAAERAGLVMAVDAQRRPASTHQWDVTVTGRRYL